MNLINQYVRPIHGAIMAVKQNEGLSCARLMMVLSSLSPLYVMWAVRGVSSVPDMWLFFGCGVLLIVPNLMLYLRYHTAKKNHDLKIITVHKSTDNREHLLVYLFAVLMPLYDANIGNGRDFVATIIAFVFIVFLFLHLNLHYMNLIFAFFRYRVYTIEPLEGDGIRGKMNFVLLTKRTNLLPEQQIEVVRLSNTVYIEKQEVK